MRRTFQFRKVWLPSAVICVLLLFAIRYGSLTSPPASKTANVKLNGQLESCQTNAIPDDWRIFVQRPGGGRNIACDVTRKGSSVAMTVNECTRDPVILCLVMPFQKKVPVDFTIRASVLFSCWQHVSVATIGYRNTDDNLYYQGRLSHPKNDTWHNIEVSPVRELRFVVDNPTRSNVQGDTVSMDYLCLYVRGIPDDGNVIEFPQPELRSPRPEGCDRPADRRPSGSRRDRQRCRCRRPGTRAYPGSRRSRWRPY